MKIPSKIFIGILLFIATFFSVFTVYAAAGGSGSSDTSIKVKVPERIPGANCTPTTGVCPEGGCTCTMEPGFKTIQAIIGQIIKWFTALAALAGVLFIVVNGILLSMHGGDKDKVKGRIIQTISGLILLLLSGVILSIIAPWIYK